MQHYPSQTLCLDVGLKEVKDLYSELLFVCDRLSVTSDVFLL